MSALRRKGMKAKRPRRVLRSYAAAVPLTDRLTNLVRHCEANGAGEHAATALLREARDFMRQFIDAHAVTDVEMQVLRDLRQGKTVALSPREQAVLRPTLEAIARGTTKDDPTKAATRQDLRQMAAGALGWKLPDS